MIDIKLLPLVLLSFFSNCSPNTTDSGSMGAPSRPPLAEAPKNVILMIGDGMGLSQITAGMYANNNFLHLEEFPVVGLQKSYAANDLITDSAAAATAMACGVKTNNGAIGINANAVEVPSILELAEAKGLSTGLVATSSIVHATPAAFYAHVKSRRQFEDIAAAVIPSGVDFLVGGGSKYFTARDDGRDLYAELRQKGYSVSDFVNSELRNIPIDFSKDFAYFTASTEPLTKEQGRDYLLPASELAPIFLSRHSNRGFFLMIEGSQIDWGGHANQSEYIVNEMIEFDKAVGRVLDFAKENGETLVIVTADHETGGYAINRGSKMDSIVPAFTSTYHTAVMVPVFAYGPGASLFAGIYENTAIFDQIQYALHLGDDQVSK